jgi:hypothetical protein
MGMFMDHMESILNEGKIVNINPRWGMSIKFDSVKEMEAAIKKSGYKIPAGGLRDGVDYESAKPELNEKYERLTDAVKKEFADLTNQLSPENLNCDGGCSAAEASRRKKAIMARWKELEQRIGMKVTEDMAYEWDSK